MALEKTKKQLLKENKKLLADKRLIIRDLIQYVKYSDFLKNEIKKRVNLYAFKDPRTNYVYFESGKRVGKMTHDEYEKKQIRSRVRNRGKINKVTPNIVAIIQNNVTGKGVKDKADE